MNRRDLFNAAAAAATACVATAACPAEDARAAAPRQIDELEETLRLAMLTGNVGKLEELLANDLIFIDQAGQLAGKEADIDAHRSGRLKLAELTFASQSVHVLGEGLVLTITLSKLAGTYASQAFSGTFRYSRVWKQQSGRWCVIFAQCSGRS